MILLQIANDAEARQVPFEEVERFAFYERAKKVRNHGVPSVNAGDVTLEQTCGMLCH